MAARFCHPIFTTFLLFFMLHPFIIKSLEFVSVQKLQQAQKGDTIDGINQIKKYLKTYGYYSQDIKHNQFDDQFDDSLEFALIKYQKYNFFNVTGKIDSDTIKAMMVPRCGFPDFPGNQVVENYSVPNFSGNQVVENYSISDFSRNQLVSNYSFPGNRWSRYQLTYRLLSYLQYEAELIPVLEKAMGSWARVSPFRFQRAAQGARADINIAWLPTSHGDGNDFKQFEWAHAFYPEDGRLHFNDNKNWATNPNQNQVDVESICVHELGHVLGLDHSQRQDAVMYYAFPGGTYTKRALTNDDIAGIRALYGF